MNKKKFIYKPPSRKTVFIVVGALHLALLFLIASSPPPQAAVQQQEGPKVIKLADLRIEEPPPPAPQQRISEAIAESIEETEETPDLVKQEEDASSSEGENYLAQNEVSSLPRFNEMDVRRATIYPPIALRAAIQGKVYLEIFVDSEGYVRQVKVLKETPEGYGFGEAAAKAFWGKRGAPAVANGSPVAVRYRYPIFFQVR
ncbi:MAG: energy transducer TonB [Spirochaetaceae bacterium]|jgi:protein TonB|nr:energy transducer TonB [Spirochaetaceae bacterium]